MAQQTVAICEAGYYSAPNGSSVNISTELATAKKGTKIYSPADLATSSPTKRHQTHIQVRNETAFQAIARLSAAAKGHLACLNFASAKNPGGGFLNGAIAQEEALASASGLYPCLLQAPAYYERNRANRSALYLDLAIFSPLVPFFRDDAGRLLAKPVLASIITAPAPNAGAVADNEPANLSKVRATLAGRADLVLSVAAIQNVDQLVLGAWGCGVFRNDPRLVAAIFKDLLQQKFAGAFENVVFAVFDRSPTQETYRAFTSAFS
jgi:uncharacterized protein (TIGR02452 family)